MGKFVISVRKSGEFQFNLEAGNGRIILTSEGYSSKSGCLGGIESVKSHVADADNFERLTSTNNKFYFVLKATNGKVIGTSEMYESSAACLNGIASVQENAVNAITEEG